MYPSLHVKPWLHVLFIACNLLHADSFYIMLIFALDKLNIRHISTSGLVDLLT